MANIFYDNQQMAKRERDRRIKEQSNFERQTARDEARNLITSSEENIFFNQKKGE